MQQKAKNSESIFQKRIKSFLKVGCICLVLPILLAFCGITILFQGPEIEARRNISSMRRWSLPPQSEFVSFDMERGTGGNGAWIYGLITIKSNLSEEEVREFYLRQYTLGCYEVGGSGLEKLGIDSDGLTFYQICMHSQYD